MERDMQQQNGFVTARALQFYGEEVDGGRGRGWGVHGGGRE